MTVQASGANTERVFSKGFAETSWNGTRRNPAYCARLGPLREVHDERLGKSHRTTEQGAVRRTDRDQPVFSPCRNVRELGLRKAVGVHQDAVDRRNETCRGAYGADSFSGWIAHNAAARADRGEECEGYAAVRPGP